MNWIRSFLDIDLRMTKWSMLAMDPMTFARSSVSEGDFISSAGFSSTNNSLAMILFAAEPLEVYQSVSLKTVKNSASNAKSSIGLVLGRSRKYSTSYSY